MNLQSPNPSPAAVSDGVFIDNDWRASASGATLDVVAPATGEVFTRIAAGNADDISAAVAAARRAREADWGQMTATQRGRILTRAADLVTRCHDQLAALEARDTGKPLSQARADIAATARYLEFYGGAADKLHGDTIPFLPGHFVTTEYVPFGVTGHIIPWNYPAQMFGRTIAASLAMGNACVLKPAEDACLTPLRLCEILCEAGLPAGALNCVPGRGDQAGAAGACGQDRLADRAFFNGGRAVRHADDDLRFGEGGPLVDLADEMLDHLFRHVEVGDDAFAHGADRLDRAGGPAQHQLGVLTDGEHLLHAILDMIGDHGGFGEHDALALHVDQCIRGPQIDCHIRGQ